eukprot:s1479_g2.t1
MRPLHLWAVALLPARVAAQATYPSEFRLDWCVGEQCFDHSISCAQFQMRLRGYYQELIQNEKRRPPLREAFFLATLPPVYQREMLLGCPGMVVLAHLLLAESRLYTHEVNEALELVARKPHVTFQGAARCLLDVLGTLATLMGQTLDSRNVHTSPIHLDTQAQSLWRKFHTVAECEKDDAPAFASGAIGKHGFTTASHVTACHLFQQAFEHIQQNPDKLCALYKVRQHRQSSVCRQHVSR